MSCRRKPLDQGQDAPVADRVRHPADQPVVRDRVEIALQVGIHHEAVACLQKPIDLPQRRLAAASRTEAVAARPELRFKDWFNGQFERRLHHPVPGFRSGQALDRRDAQRAGLAVPLGYLDPFHRSRPIAAVLQLLVKLRQIPLRLRREPFDALSINPRRPLVPLDSRPSGRQGRRPIDLVYQTEPLGPPHGSSLRPARGHALTPLTSADTMRSVQIEASVHRRSRRRASVPCVASSALPGRACRASDIAPPTPCLPSLGAVLLPAPFTAPGAIGTTKALILPPSPERQVSPLTPSCRPAIPPPTTRSVRWPLYQSSQRHRLFRASPSSSKLATGSRRNGFVLLQTGGSPPVAPHPASRRRSFLRLQSHDTLRQGLPPC